MATAQATAPRSQNIVVVGCKLPNGLQIEHFEKGHTDDGKVIFRRPDARIEPDKRVILKGANSSNVVGGFGMTEVDADFWDAWIKQHAGFPAVKSGVIFAHDRRELTASHAMDHAEAKTGMEPIDPDKPGKGIEKVPEKELKARAAMS